MSAAMLSLVSSNHRVVISFFVGFFVAVLLCSSLPAERQTFSGTPTGTLDPVAMVVPDAGGGVVLAPSTAMLGDEGNKSSTAETEKTYTNNGESESKNRTKEDESMSSIVGDNPIPSPPPICDLSDKRYDICDITGDARAVGGEKTILYISPASASGEWTIRDQSRKNLEWVKKVTVKALPSSSPPSPAPDCTTRSTLPAVVFSVGALTANPWHAFSDVLIPLFITAGDFAGEVELLVTDYRQWFVDKYAKIFANMSHFPVINLDSPDSGIRCYRRIIVGLRSHRDLGIDPARTAHNYTLVHFKRLLRQIYSLPEEEEEDKRKKMKKPRLLLVNRAKTRRFVNLPKVAGAAAAAGFEVIVREFRRDDKVEEVAKVVDTCDVLMGVHGAALTNFFFLRAGAVVLQVVPWGNMGPEATAYYSRQAAEMGLREVRYTIAAAESTLLEKYGKESPVIADPEAINRQGWQQRMRYYWNEQDIRLNVTRFAGSLAAVKAMVGGTD